MEQHKHPLKSGRVKSSCSRCGTYVPLVFPDVLTLILFQGNVLRKKIVSETAMMINLYLFVVGRPSWPCCVCVKSPCDCDCSGFPGWPPYNNPIRDFPRKLDYFQ